MKSFKELVEGKHFFRLRLTDERFVNLYAMFHNFVDPVGTNPDGDPKWIFASRKHHQGQEVNNEPDAVTIVPIRSDGDSLKVVMTREFRYPIMDYEWSFPAGLIDKGESIEVAAARELKEETGLKMEKVIEETPACYKNLSRKPHGLALGMN